MAPSALTAARQRLLGEFEISKLHLKLHRNGSRDLRRVIRALAVRMRTPEIRRLRQEMQPVLGTAPTSAAKYSDYRLWIPFNGERAVGLGLDECRPLKILDIGCGPGYFMAVARSLGHDCEGLELPEEELSPVERRVYSDLLQALGCTELVRRFRVRPFTPLPLAGKRYDLITAFWICFNGHMQSTEWGEPEWRFFVDDVSSHLTESGRAVLELNENRERYGELRFFDAATADLFWRIGTVDQSRVSFSKQSG